MTAAQHLAIVPDVPAEPDVIGSTEAARILGTTIVTVCRWVDTGYLATRRRSRGKGQGGHRFDLDTVEALAERRAAAKRTLDWRGGGTI